VGDMLPPERLYKGIPSKVIATIKSILQKKNSVQKKKNTRGENHFVINNFCTLPLKEPAMFYLQYNTNLKTFSRKLRRHSTKGEIALWKKLRAGQMYGYTFNRQKPLNRYIVDFYCKPLNLVIEVDEKYHNHPVQRLKDSERQGILEKMKLNFLRFTDEQILNDMEIVLRIVRNYIVSYEFDHPGMTIPVRRNKNGRNT
jgi:very-short-patch-repair endonuclease